jgi:toxin ParE1/3/4
VRVRYTLPALANLEAILDYIGAQSPRGAKRVQAKIMSLIDLLPRQPLIGTRTDDPPIRRLVVTPYPYLVFCEPAADEIIIHAIRHATRKPIATPGWSS